MPTESLTLPERVTRFVEERFPAVSPDEVIDYLSDGTYVSIGALEAGVSFLEADSEFACELCDDGAADELGGICDECATSIAQEARS